MKHLLLTIISLTFLFSCKNETSKTETKKTSGKVETFDCTTFFSKGDYSSICFNNIVSPENNSPGCIVSFKTKGNKQEERLLAQFTNKNSAMLAEMHHNYNKITYKKGNIKVVSNLGDDAFFDIYGKDLKSLSRSNKDLNVLHKNMAFVIMAEYMTNKGEPCFYSDKQLIAFAKIIISNL